MVYNFYRRMCAKLGIVLCREMMLGPQSFRRNIGTKLFNNTGGNIALVNGFLGNKPEVFFEHYYAGVDQKQMASALSDAGWGDWEKQLDFEATASKSMEINEGGMFRQKENPETPIV